MRSLLRVIAAPGSLSSIASLCARADASSLACSSLRLGVMLLWKKKAELLSEEYNHLTAEMSSLRLSAKVGCCCGLFGGEVACCTGVSLHGGLGNYGEA